jgi:flavin-dependent dehydrogenase
VAAAAEAGADVRTETTALVIPESDEQAGASMRCVSLQGAGAGAGVAQARALVVADGLGHDSLRECASFQSRVSVSSRIGISGETGAGAIDVEPGGITMAVSRCGYVGAVGIEDGRVNIAAAVDALFLRASGGPAGAVHAILRHAGVAVHAPLESIDWMGTLPLTRRLAPLAARGIFVVGDAAGYVEPFTGEGMAWALTGAETVVPFVRRAVESPGAAREHEWGREHAKTIGREQRWCRVLAACLRRPALVTWLLTLLQRHPGVAAPALAHFSPRMHPASERSP